jgi:drug/metabolite transporter (DMT)-like permease
VSARRSPPAGLVLLVCTAVWGSTFAITKDLVAAAPPLRYLAIRFDVAALLLLPLLVARRGRLRSEGLSRDLLVIGLCNAIGLVFQVLGQVYTTASKSAFITSLGTPLTALIGLLVYGIVPSAAQRTAVALATLGLVLLTWPAEGARLNPGDLLTVGTAIAYGLFITETARRAPRHDAAVLAIGQVLIAAALFTLCSAATQLAARVLPLTSWPELLRLEARPFPVGARTLAQLAYMSIVCVVAIMLVQTWALQRLSAATAAVIFATEPVFATAIAVGVDGASEWPGPRGAVGALLVLLAVYVAEARNLRRASSTAQANTSQTAASGGEPERDISQP